MPEGDAALEPVLARATELAIPAVVLGEYRYGILQSATGADTSRG